MKCIKCGEDNPKTNRFCDNCGSKLAAAEAGGAVAVLEKPQPAPGAAKVSRRPAAVATAGGSSSWMDAEFYLDKEKFIYIAIILVGAFLRLWALGDKPLHHDESIHAWYSFKLFNDGGAAYKYDPAYHGPFLYHANALMYFLFGTSDFASRLLPAIFGIGMLWFLWKWRAQLGRTGALLAAAFMAVSPTITYVSRFIRDDIYMALGCMVMVWNLFRFFEEHRPKHLYWFSAGLIVSFASMEATWIFSGILGTFLFFRWFWERSNALPEENQVHRLISYLADKRNRAVVGWVAAIFFVPFTFLFTSMFTNADGWFIGLFDSLAYWMGEQKTGRADQPVYFYICLLALYELGICGFALLGGLKIYFGAGKPQLLLLKLLGGIIPFALAMIIISNYPKSPGLLPIMAGLCTLGCGIIAYCTFVPGNLFKVFLLYWSILALCMFTLAGERMPWLTLHPLLPMTLLGAMYLGEFFEREPSQGEHWVGVGLLWLPVSYVALAMLLVLRNAAWQAPKEIASFVRDVMHGERHGSFRPSGLKLNNLWDSPLFVWMPLAIFALAFFATPWLLAKRPELKRLTRGVWMVLLVGGLGFLLHGTCNLLFYGDGASPAEQLVYVQSTTEIPKLEKRLADMSVALTGGMDMKVGVEDLCSWPLSWYLRGFKNAQIGFHPPLLAEQVKDYPVIITAYDTNPPASPDHDQKVIDSFKENYSPQRVKLRAWWGPNKEALLGKDVKFADMAKRVGRLFMFREPWLPLNPSNDPNFSKNAFGVQTPIGSYDMCVWVRKDVEKYFR